MRTNDAIFNTRYLILIILSFQKYLFHIFYLFNDIFLSFRIRDNPKFTIQMKLGRFHGEINFSNTSEIRKFISFIRFRKVWFYIFIYSFFHTYNNHLIFNSFRIMRNYSYFKNSRKFWFLLNFFQIIITLY